MRIWGGMWRNCWKPSWLTGFRACRVVPESLKLRSRHEFNHSLSLVSCIQSRLRMIRGSNSICTRLRLHPTQLTNHIMPHGKTDFFKEKQKSFFRIRLWFDVILTTYKRLLIFLPHSFNFVTLKNNNNNNKIEISQILWKSMRHNYFFIYFSAV